MAIAAVIDKDTNIVTNVIMVNGLVPDLGLKLAWLPEDGSFGIGDKCVEISPITGIGTFEHIG